MLNPKVIILAIFAVALSFMGCAGPSNAPMQAKHRKVALHGYVYAKTKTLEETVREARELGAEGVVCSASQKLGGPFKNVKFSVDMTPEQRDFVKKIFAENKIEMVSFGIGDLKKGETPDKYLAFCAEMGIPVFTWEGDPQSAQKWQDAAAKYGVKVAIHNHEYNPKRLNYVYWNPKYVWEIIKDKPNMYACADNGHWVRSGLDVAQGYKNLRGRLAAIHFKDPGDLMSLAKNEKPLGQGALNLKNCLKVLDELGYDGFFVLENEQVFDNPTPAMRASIKYLREH